MTDQFSRTRMLIGSSGLEKLKRATVAIFGVGGVGSYVVEALVRCGVGHFILVDSDKVSLTNLNRQIIATHQTIGLDKVEVMKARMKEINPQVDVTIIKRFFLPENAKDFPFHMYSYIVDAVDTVSAKIELAVQAKQADIPIISSMGTGNKLNPEAFEICDLYQTVQCPLARVMRRELKKREIKALKVVYSKEEAIKPDETEEEPGTKRSLPGSISFVPGTAGLIIAGEVVKDLLKF